MSEKLEGEGFLIFEDINLNERIHIHWKMVSDAPITEKGSWRASITFFSLPVPTSIIRLIFKALSTPSTSLTIQTDVGAIANCHICEMDDLPDSGSIEVASLDRPGARITWGNGPNL